jgi:hypothetical protein
VYGEPLHGTYILVEEHKQLLKSIPRHMVYGESLYGTVNCDRRLPLMC